VLGAHKAEVLLQSLMWEMHKMLGFIVYLFIYWLPLMIKFGKVEFIFGIIDPKLVTSKWELITWVKGNLMIYLNMA